MSIFEKINKNSTMGTPLFHEFKKQASFFLKEKIKTARLALTDVTPAQLLTEEATNGNPWAPDTRTMGLISRAAFEVDDYWRIVEILHKRLFRFDRKNWRLSYKSLILLEHLLTHGPERVAEEFQSDIDVIQEMGSFQYIDEKGFNWGINVREKSERILKLLSNKGTLLKQERDRARKLTRGIKGFGSFSEESATADGSFREGLPVGNIERCKSDYVNHYDNNNQFFLEESVSDGIKKKKQHLEKEAKDMDIESETRRSSKENIIPDKKESKPLLGNHKDEANTKSFVEEDHPFNDLEPDSTEALLSA